MKNNEILTLFADPFVAFAVRIPVRIVSLLDAANYRFIRRITAYIRSDAGGLKDAVCRRTLSNQGAFTCLAIITSGATIAYHFKIIIKLSFYSDIEDGEPE